MRGKEGEIKNILLANLTDYREPKSYAVVFIDWSDFVPAETL